MENVNSMWEPEWHSILLRNLQNALDLCNDAGIKILDEDNGEWKLIEVSYSPAMHKTYFKTRAVENEAL